MPKMFRDTLLRKFEAVRKTDLPRGVLAVLRGPCMEIEKVNENSRWYPRSLIMNRILNDADTNHLMKNRALIGEGCHPEDRFHSEYPNTAILILKLWIPEDDPDRLWIEFWVLDTPVGRIIKTLIDVGSSIGISARAAGDAEERDGVEYMDEDTYTFFTFDCVPDPGFKTARPIPVNEQKLLGRKLEDYSTLELEQTQQIMENLNPDFFADQLTQVKSLLEQKDRKDTSKTFEELCEAKRRISALEKSLESAKATNRSHYRELPRSVVEQMVRVRKETKSLEEKTEQSRRVNHQLRSKLESREREYQKLRAENEKLKASLSKTEESKKVLEARLTESDRKLNEERKKPRQGQAQLEALQLRVKNERAKAVSLVRELYESKVAYLATKTNLPVSRVKALVPVIDGNPDKYIKQLRKVEQHSAVPIRGTVTEQDDTDMSLVSLISSQAKGV